MPFSLCVYYYTELKPIFIEAWVFTEKEVLGSRVYFSLILLQFAQERKLKQETVSSMLTCKSGQLKKKIFYKWIPSFSWIDGF